jgi:hypothetical protein
MLPYYRKILQINIFFCSLTTDLRSDHLGLGQQLEKFSYHPWSGTTKALIIT